MEWSVARYQDFSYEDNILHKSFQDRLCLPLPIDVVYTWVNGTDLRLLKDLAKLKKEIEGSLNESSTESIYEKVHHSQKLTIHKKPNLVSKNGSVGTTLKPKEGCPYQNCVPLNSLVLKLHSETRKADFKAVDPVFKDAVRVSNFTLESSGAKKSSVTVVKFSKESSLKHAVNRAFTIKGERVVAQQAYLTSQAVKLSVQMRAVVMISIKKEIVDGKSFKQFLYLRFSEKIKKLEYYEKEKVAVLTFKDDQGYAYAMGLHKGELTFQNVPLVFEPALLVWEPFPVNSDINDKDNHFLASRFADNQELRYSLRSVEKYAPWVRMIFIVTNGQIPSWLNLDNPRVKVITHSEIFTNNSHLPTFSSPAIESHLHKIPGLSKKFIYLNDDVMFGTEVWPDDFFTHSKGQRIFLSWSVPNCNEGCPSTWINDKYCDKACNMSECDWDGGDCIGSKTKAHKWQSVISRFKKTKLNDFCNSGCADSWIGDRYCDSACNNPGCGLDAGDCGVKSFSQLYSVMLHVDTEIIHLPNRLQAMFFNLSEVFGKGKIIEGEHDGSSILRSVTIAQKFKVMTLTFNPNHTLTTATLRLVGHQTLNDTKKLEVKFNVTIETKSYEVAITSEKGLGLVLPTKDLLEHDTPITLYPIKIYNTSNTIHFWNVKHGSNGSMPSPTWKEVNQNEYCVPTIPDDMTVPQEVVNQIAELGKELESGDITDKGYKRKKAKLLRERLGIACNSDFHPTTIHSEMRYMKSMTSKTGHVQQPTTDINLEKQSLGRGYSSRHLNNFEEARAKWSFLPWEKQGIFKELQEKQNLMEIYKTTKFQQRTLLHDAFSGSLLHVNRIYNRAFGYKARKVPSHMPHMVDVDIINELQALFPEEFDTTSSHKLRSPNDMQFAFSYFYYIIDQTKEFNFSCVFQEVDADKSGTLSDREIRTLMAKIHTLPLDAKTVQNFTSILKNCSGAQLGEQARGPRPKAEQQYGGYGLPALITESLLRGCAGIMKQINNSKNAENKFKHEIVGDGDSAFKMIKNNASHVVLQLDEIRKNKKKFICLNDNIDHDKGNSSLVKNLLVDFYESLFPVSSQFELPNNLRNRFLYVDELKAWRKERQKFEFRSDGLLVIMGIVVLLCIFGHQLLCLIRRVVKALSRIMQTSNLSTSYSTKLLTV